MTQGYGVGSHAPAEIWGAVDLAIDGNGDGQADPQGTDGTPVYATHDGVVKLARDTYPAGNHIWVIGNHYKTGYSHLRDFAVQEGQAVKRGDVIGYVGSTGAVEWAAPGLPGLAGWRQRQPAGFRRAGWGTLVTGF